MAVDKTALEEHLRSAIERCAARFAEMPEPLWKAKSTRRWTAKDYLAHLVASHEHEGLNLTQQALSGDPGELAGFAGREKIDEYNEIIMAESRKLPVPQLLERFEREYRHYADMLGGLTESDLSRPATNPGWGDAGTVGDLFVMTYLHLPTHYQDIRRAVRRLPHWVEISENGDLHFQLDRTFHYMPLLYWPARGRRTHASYLFTIVGRGGGQWTVSIEGDRAVTSDGRPGAPNVQLTTSARSWADLTTGDLNPVWGLLKRQLSFRGNPMLLVKLERLFEVT